MSFTEGKKQNALESLIFPLGFVAILWLIEMVEFVFELSFVHLGVHPRAIDGILGIFTSPFIHDGFSHLISNSIPLLVLSTLIIHFYREVAFRAFGLIYILTGISIWIFARGTTDGGTAIFHIGASGLVYGLVAFIFWVGIFAKNRTSIVLALLMVFAYSGMFLGVVPNDDGISWESHLLGGIIGIGVAYFYKNDLRIEEEIWEDTTSTVEHTGNYFLPRDAFEKTKEQREIEAQTKVDQFQIKWHFKSNDK